MASSLWWMLGGLSGALAVVTGAFGAHGLKKRVADLQLLKTWETGAYYHMIHSFALLAVALCPRQENANTAGGLFLSGMTLFSGSLYALVLTNKKKLGAITPIGGLLLIAGWVYLALACTH